jgi:hypothetical protein
VGTVAGGLGCAVGTTAGVPLLQSTSGGFVHSTSPKMGRGPLQ